MTDNQRVLQLLVLLAGGNRGVADLARDLECSEVTVKRAIAAARVLGAHIGSFGGGYTPWLYRLCNWEMLRAQVELRLALEKCSLCDPVPVPAVFNDKQGELCL